MAFPPARRSCPPCRRATRTGGDDHPRSASLLHKRRAHLPGRTISRFPRRCHDWRQSQWLFGRPACPCCLLHLRPALLSGNHAAAAGQGLPPQPIPPPVSRKLRRSCSPGHCCKARRGLKEGSRRSAQNRHNGSRQCREQDGQTSPTGRRVDLDRDRVRLQRCIGRPVRAVRVGIDAPRQRLRRSPSAGLPLHAVALTRHPGSHDGAAHPRKNRGSCQRAERRRQPFGMWD